MDVVNSTGGRNSMGGSVSRRSLLAAGAVLGVGAAAGTAGTASANPGGSEERASLEQLHRAAVAEGGHLVMYAGGDTPTQQDGTKAAFEAAFPDVKLTIVVDYSKYHDVRIDNQYATGDVVPDVVQLQTLHDFTRWKKLGKLLQYRPAGFSKVHPLFKDPDGTSVGVSALAFSFFQAQGLAVSPRDLAKPEWQGRIASAYPHDDDAVLYLYKLYVDAFGWDWLAALAGRGVEFARGSHTPGIAVGSGRKAVGIGTAGSLLGTGPARWSVPSDAPFMAWGQRAAILKVAKRPAAAKLYLNWQLSAAQQRASFNGWSVRTDITPDGGLKPLWTYPNANIEGFTSFMADRAEVERWKQTFALYLGEVTGPPTPGTLGLRPGA
jgi:ABC-type Fe3+ transport system substrate-binding protein